MNGLATKLRAAEAQIIEEPELHGEKRKGWWLITPVGNFLLRGRGGAETNAAALEMVTLLEGGEPGPDSAGWDSEATPARKKRPTTYRSYD